MLANHEDSTGHRIAEVPSRAQPHPLGPLQRV